MQDAVLSVRQVDLDSRILTQHLRGSLAGPWMAGESFNRRCFLRKFGPRGECQWCRGKKHAKRPWHTMSNASRQQRIPTAQTGRGCNVFGVVIHRGSIAHLSVLLLLRGSSYRKFHGKSCLLEHKNQENHVKQHVVKVCVSARGSVETP